MKKVVLSPLCLLSKLGTLDQFILLRHFCGLMWIRLKYSDGQAVSHGWGCKQVTRSTHARIHCTKVSQTLISWENLNITGPSDSWNSYRQPRERVTAHVLAADWLKVPEPRLEWVSAVRGGRGSCTHGRVWRDLHTSAGHHPAAAGPPTQPGQAESHAGSMTWD